MSRQIDDLCDETDEMPTADADSSDEKKRKPWWRKLLKALLIVLLVLLALLIVIAVTVTILYFTGKSAMLNYDDASIAFPQSEESVQAEDASRQEPEEYILSYDDGKTVSYQGKTYVLNENVTAILFIGVDKEEVELNEINGSGGEADTILLIGVDTVTGQTNVVSVSRDSYAQVDIYSANGRYLESRSTQL